MPFSQLICSASPGSYQLLVRSLNPHFSLYTRGVKFPWLCGLDQDSLPAAGWQVMVLTCISNESLLLGNSVTGPVPEFPSLQAGWNPSIATSGPWAFIFDTPALHCLLVLTSSAVSFIPSAPHLISVFSKQKTPHSPQHFFASSQSVSLLPWVSDPAFLPKRTLAFLFPHVLDLCPYIISHPLSAPYLLILISVKTLSL